MRCVKSMIRICLCAVMIAGNLYAGLTFSPDEYRARREKLMDSIETGAVVLPGAVLPTASYPFYQTNDFLYLTGVVVPDCMLIIDADTRESHLFFTISETAARNEGVPLELVRDPQGVTGIEHIHPLDNFLNVLSRIGGGTGTLYTMFQPEERMRECSLEKKRTRERSLAKHPWLAPESKEERFVSYLKNAFPERGIHDCSEKIWELRIIKSPAEIDLLRRAGRIAVEAHRRVIQSTRVGMSESELAALFRYYCKKEGAQDLAYETIVCSGPNHPYLHYYAHDRILQEGDFLVIDAGPDYHYYDIDITVSYPANGRFTARQREIYTIANTMHEACMQVYRPGLSREQARREVREILLNKGIDPDGPMFSQRGMKYVFGHYVGMAVHDVGIMPEVLKPGMVLANEPFAVFAEEHLGVRVEDTILITEDGCENLTPGLPRTIEEIETFMRQEGPVQVLKQKGMY